VALMLRRLLGAGAGLMLLAAACSGNPSVTPSASDTSPDPTAPTTSPSFDDDRGGTLRVGLADNPFSIDPRFIVDEEGALIADALFDGLVAIGEDLRTIVPAAAESWTINDDGTIYEFALREGTTFHDGTPVTAEDFVRSFQRIADGTADPASFGAYKLEAIVGFEEAQASGTPLSGVESMEDGRLRIELQYPFAELLAVLTDPALAPVPAPADDAPDAFAESPVGNGPFEMAEPWQQNQFIRLAASDGHWTTPLLDEVLFQIYTGATSAQEQYRDFEEGLLDVAEIPDDQVAVAIDRFGESADGYTGPGVLTGTTGTLYFFGFNTELAPFDDPAVRQALSRLIDRQGIAQELLRSAREPAVHIVPPALPGGGEVTCSHCSYDPESAHAALTREDGTSRLDGLTLLHNEGDTNALIARRVADDIGRALEIEVEVEAVTLSDLVVRIRAGEVQMFRYGWSADYPTPGSYLLPQFRSATRGSDNLTNFSNPDVDDLLLQAQGELDLDQRLDLYRQAEEAILEAAPIAPVFFYRLNKVVADGVQGFASNPLGRVDLTEVWVERGP